MRISNVIALVLAFLSIGIFMSIGGSLVQFIDFPAMLIVFIGGAFLTLAAYSPARVWQTIKDLWNPEQADVSGKEKRRFLEGAEIFERIETIFLSLGFAGMFIGIINCLAHLGDPSIIGPSMAVGLISGFYSVILSKVICQTARLKLLQRANSLEKAYKFTAPADWRLLLLVALSLFLFVPLPY